MKALLVTSRVTFAPDNYNGLIAELASCPQLGGLLVLSNAEIKLLGTGLALVGLGARQMGTRLVMNQLGVFERQRQAAYRAAGKPIWTLPTLNCPEALELVKREGFDLIVNARTRCIYKKAILEAPRLGCINVHHGLLPLQRGTMCDLWSLHDGVPTGFTIHRMNTKIDAGHILRAVQVSDGSDRNYADYLRRGIQREHQELSALLAAIEADEGQLEGTPNVGDPSLKHRRNPSVPELRGMLKKGLRL